MNCRTRPAIRFPIGHSRESTTVHRTTNDKTADAQLLLESEVMDQSALSPGSESVSSTLLAGSVAVAWLVTPIVKPIGLPAATEAASAVLVTASAGHAAI